MTRKRPNTSAAALGVRPAKSPRRTAATPARAQTSGANTVSAAPEPHEFPETLAFDRLAKILEPESQPVPAVWKTHISRNNQQIFFYQLNLLAKPPRFLKSVLLNYRNIPLSSGSRHVLHPTVYIGDKQLPAAHIKEVVGRSFIQFVEDLTALLEHVDEATATDLEGLDEVRSVAGSEMMPVLNGGSASNGSGPSSMTPMRSSVPSTSAGSVINTSISRTKSGRVVNKPAYRGRDSAVDSSDEDMPSASLSEASNRTINTTVPAVTPQRKSVITPVPFARASTSSTTRTVPRPGTATPRTSTTSGIVKKRRKRRTTVGLYRPKPRPKTSGDVSAVKNRRFSPLIPIANTAAIRQPSSTGLTNGLTNGEASHGTPPNALNGDDTTGAGSTLYRIQLYRQLAAAEVGKDVDDDFGLSHNQIWAVNNAFKEETAVKEGVWRSGLGMCVKFALRPLPVWKELKTMYNAFKGNEELMDAVRMSYFRDYMARVSDEEAIDCMRQCVLQMSIQPLADAFRDRTKKAAENHKATKLAAATAASGLINGASTTPVNLDASMEFEEPHTPLSGHLNGH